MFDIIGIIFLVIILILLIIGFAKGFVSLVLGLAKGLVAIFLAALLCRPIGMALNNSSMGESLINKIETSLVEIDPMFNEVITNDNKQQFIEQELNEKLQTANLPETISKYVSNLISSKVEINSNEGISCGKYIATGISMFVLIIISFVVLAIIIFIILFIIQKLAKNINLIPLVGIANRLLGVFLGLIIALLFISIISYILSFMMALPWDLADSIKDTLKLGEEHKEEFTIGKFFYEHNILKWLFGLIFKK